MIIDELRRSGFAFVDDVGDNVSIREFGESLGAILQVPNVPLIQRLTPKSKEAELPNTYSGLFGYGDFPFHTDMAHWHVPPRYIVMRCAIPDEDVSTTLIRANLVLPDPRTPAAKRALFRPRRRLDNKSYFVKLSEDRLSRWDSVFIQPANPVAWQLKHEIENRLRTISAEHIRFTRAGQVLIIDNWLVLHGRSSVEDPSRGRLGSVGKPPIR